MLMLDNVSFSYGDKTVLENFSLTVDKGECVCLSGPSGCGKTTVTRIVMGLEKPKSGTVVAPRKVSCVFQEDRLLSHLSLQKNIRLVLKESQYEYADRLLELFGLGDSLCKSVNELSGGMKRRAAIVRALAYGGDLLILDEAFNGIDEENKSIISQTIKEDFLDKGKSVLMITHVLDDAELLSARIIDMKKDTD